MNKMCCHITRSSHYLFDITGKRYGVVVGAKKIRKRTTATLVTSRGQRDLGGWVIDGGIEEYAELLEIRSSPSTPGSSKPFLTAGWGCGPVPRAAPPNRLQRAWRPDSDGLTGASRRPRNPLAAGSGGRSLGRRCGVRLSKQRCGDYRRKTAAPGAEASDFVSLGLERIALPPRAYSRLAAAIAGPALPHRVPVVSIGKEADCIEIYVS